MSKKNIYDTALYLRLSKDDADIDGSKKTESNSIRSQRDLLRAYVLIVRVFPVTIYGKSADTFSFQTFYLLLRLDFCSGKRGKSKLQAEKADQ